MQASICNTSHTIKCSILNLFGFGQYFLDYPGELFCPILTQMVLVVEIRIVKPFVCGVLKNIDGSEGLRL